MQRTLHDGFVLMLALALAGAAACAEARSDDGASPQSVAPAFEGSRAEAETFMEYYDSIQLTAPQEAIRKEALTAMPAPCCSNFSAATCCCECNLSRTIWGLSKYLIAREGRGAEEVRAAAEAWVDAVNPAGFPGDTCSSGGCGRSFSEAGCGGMNPHQLEFE